MLLGKFSMQAMHWAGDTNRELVFHPIVLRVLPIAGHLPDRGLILCKKLAHILSSNWLKFDRGAGSCFVFVASRKIRKVHGTF